MLDTQHTTLAGSVTALYRQHCGLLWRIIMPVVIIATLLDMAMFLRVAISLEEETLRRRAENAQVVTANVNTRSGIHPTIRNPEAGPAVSSDVSWRFYVIPEFISTDDKGVTWEWSLNFRTLEYSVLVLLLLTFAPLSLAVADAVQNSRVPTARDVWRQTRRKAFPVFGCFLIFIVIVDIGSYLYGMLTWVIPALFDRIPVELTFAALMAAHIYLGVTLSLYNPCLILDNRGLFGAFRRSHALVRGARLRFFGIYLITGWIASVLTAVLFGITLLGLSLFISDLAPVRDALSPLKFLSLFLGGHIQIVLPELLSAPVTVAIFVVKGLIAAFLVPIWAILTTLLYLKQATPNPDLHAHG